MQELFVEPLLARQRALLRRQRAVFKSLEFGGDVALGVFQRLAAAVVGGHFGGLALADFDEKAVHFVELHAQVGNAGAFALARFECEQKVVAVFGDGAQLVEFGIQPGGNDAAVAYQRGRLIEQAGLQKLHALGRGGQIARQLAQQGVAREGNINSQRIIAMLTVKDDTLIVEEKGIYSIEEFLVARRLMYWQVYLHKTSIGAEFVLIRILARVKELTQQGKKLPMTTALRFFVENHITKETFDRHALHLFAQLDDYDIISGLKEWQYGDDWVLAKLSQMILNRDLLRVKLYKSPVEKEKVQELLQETALQLNISEDLAHYFVFTGEISNTAYRKDEQNILIYTKNNKIVDVTKASDQMNLDALSTKVTKYYLCSLK